jgi:DNA-binding NarL/FixJ family response regulator
MKIGVVDDHYFYRYGISQGLKQIEFVELVFNAENGLDFIEKQRISPAEVIFLDINMPVMDGYETLRVASKEFPALKFIILTMLDGDKYIDEILKVGVHGYLMKNMDQTELEASLRAIMKGRYYYCSEVVSYLSGQFNKAHESFNTPSKLTKREIEILHLIYEGCSNKEISEKLYISLCTVKNHRYNLKKKTDVKNTAGLISYGIKNNLIRYQKIDQRDII